MISSFTVSFEEIILPQNNPSTKICTIYSTIYDPTMSKLYLAGASAKWKWLQNKTWVQVEWYWLRITFFLLLSRVDLFLSCFKSWNFFCELSYHSYFPITLLWKVKTNNSSASYCLWGNIDCSCIPWCWIADTTS